MPYIHDNLLHDEKVIYWTRPHWIIFAPAVLLVIAALLVLGYLPNLGFFEFQFFGMSLYKLCALIIFVVAIFQGITAYIMYKNSEYGITNKRIVMKTGWLRRHSVEIFLEKVEALYVNQSIPGRFINYGIITIVGTGGSKDPFLYVPQPLTFRNQAQQQIDLVEQSYRDRG